MSAIDFLEEITNLQNNWAALRYGGFYNKAKEARALEPVMQKFGMTYEEARNAAMGRLTLHEYLRILRRMPE